MNKQEFNLNMTEERENECFITHAPLGVPILLIGQAEQSNSSDHVLLVNEDYITGRCIDYFRLVESEKKKLSTNFCFLFSRI